MLRKMESRGFTKRDVRDLYFHGAEYPVESRTEIKRFGRTAWVGQWRALLVWYETATEIIPISIQRLTKNPNWQEGP